MLIIIDILKHIRNRQLNIIPHVFYFYGFEVFLSFEKFIYLVKETYFTLNVIKIEIVALL